MRLKPSTKYVFKGGANALVEATFHAKQYLPRQFLLIFLQNIQFLKIFQLTFSKKTTKKLTIHFGDTSRTVFSIQTHKSLSRGKDNFSCCLFI